MALNFDFLMMTLIVKFIEKIFNKNIYQKLFPLSLNQEEMITTTISLI
jgi:hypothetical protein